MLSSTNSELYADNSGNAYDGLNRLQHFQRGSLLTGHDSISGLSFLTHLRRRLRFPRQNR